MPRPPRIDFADAVYHVTSRGNGRAKIFLNDDDRSRFVRQLRDQVEAASIRLYAYVLLDNHFHLLARTPRANLSQFMQRLNTSYALYARYKHRRPGHQFEARFKAKLVEDDTYLLALSRYIHLNPVKIADCRRLSTSERVERLEGYRWSSYPGYVAKKNASDFVCYDVLRQYGSTLPAARRHYRAYTHACVMEDDGPLLKVMGASRYAIGSDRFINKTLERLQKRCTGSVRDKDLDLPAVTVEIDVVDSFVSKHYRMDPADLAEHGRRAGAAKFVAVELACRLTGLSGRAVGLHYGGISSAAVSIIRRKIRQGDRDVAPVVSHLQQKIAKSKRLPAGTKS
jgi:REP element-mobilizing transposase RayT